MSAIDDFGHLAQHARVRLGHRRLEALAFWLTVAVAATLPLEFTKQWFPVTWIELSRVLMVAAIVVSAVVAIRQGAWAAPSGLGAAGVLVVVTAALSAVVHPQATDPKAFASSFIYLAFAFTVSRNIHDLRGLGVVAGAVVASALVVALVAVIEQVFDVYLWRADIIELGRRNSTLGDPNVTARVLAIGLAALLGLLAAARAATRRDLVVAIAVAALLGVGEALTQSRTVWVLTVLALAAWIPMALSRRRTLLPLAAFAGAMAAAILILPFLASRAGTINPDDLIDEGTVLSPAAAMAIGPPTPADPLISSLPLDGVRRYLIRAGVAMWLDHPATGVGLGGFALAMRGPYSDYIPPDRRNSPIVLLHTDAVRVLAETGLVGFAGWLAFVGAMIWAGVRLLRRSGWPRAVGMATLVAFGIILLASQLAGRFATEPYLWLLLGVLIAVPRFEAQDTPAHVNRD